MKTTTISLALLALLLTGTSPRTQETTTLQFNFRGVPIETVLDYLSEAAGFIIVSGDVDLSAEITAWSNQPIDSEEAVALLDTLLADENMAVIRNGRILKIVDEQDANRETLPVKKGSDPEQIPQNDRMVTQIIPVRYTNAEQLIETLEPLLPEEATLTANQDSNALVLTDRQVSVHRFAEIVTALDTSIAGISTIRVFPLEFADATELAEIIQSIFSMPQSSSRSSRSSDFRAMLAQRYSSSRGRDGDSSRSRSSSRSTNSTAMQAAVAVVAVADERTNSLVVSAPDDYLPAIVEIVQQIDQNVDDITEIQVFQLENADATETAQTIGDLFDGQDDADDQSSIRFGRGLGGLFDRGRGSSDNNQTETRRLQQQNTVVAVADPRTNSVIVLAAGTFMPQIRLMIDRLDADKSKRQKVYVYSLEHADADNVAEILRGMFEDRLNGASRAVTRQNAQQNNPLNNRTVTTQSIRGATQ